jgi:hypothetical protein
MIRASAVAAMFFASATAALAQPSAPPTSPQDPPCLRQRNIYSFDTVPGNRSLVVTDIARKRYRLNFLGVCPNLQFNVSLAFQSRGVGTLACIDKGDTVYQNDPVGIGQCIVRDVQYQTPALDQADAAEKARRDAR